MARARKVEESIVQRTKVNRIQLTLTEGEADFLLAVLSKIGGSPVKSPRKYQERISKALTDATGLNFTDTDAYALAHGGLMMDSYPDTANGTHQSLRSLTGTYLDPVYA
jgi:hypothetical protein